MQQLFFACTVKGGSFFGFPPWWKYIKETETDALGVCVPKFNFPNDIWAITLAVISMLLYLAGIVAVISIIVAGIGYINAGGNPDKAASARKRIYNSLLGLAIVLVATAGVTFIGNQLIK
jgi:hypothetical protein